VRIERGDSCNTTSDDTKTFAQVVAMRKHDAHGEKVRPAAKTSIVARGGFFETLRAQFVRMENQNGCKMAGDDTKEAEEAHKGPWCHLTW
jgi:hypothetical protein